MFERGRRGRQGCAPGSPVQPEPEIRKIFRAIPVEKLRFFPVPVEPGVHPLWSTAVLLLSSSGGSCGICRISRSFQIPGLVSKR